jgi:hypothetical protein
MLELLDTSPDTRVAEAEFFRLLGYPRGHVPGERARELAAWARRWYAEHGRPWVYAREATLDLGSPSGAATATTTSLRLDGVTFESPKLREHLVASQAQRAVLVAVGAGRSCEEHARTLWQDNKPDEYFFLEIFGSAVVEHLVAAMSGRICDLAERDGFLAVPHYSPGYAGWDITEQQKLFDVLATRRTKPFPETLDVLASGMLRPKKSLLAVFGLTARTPEALRAPQVLPCEGCAFTPCQYRRVPYRHAVAPTTAPSTADLAVSHSRGSPLTRNARYSINPRALEKWTRERVQLTPQSDGTVHALFRFDGTTCSNMGHPITFEYRVVLGPAADGFPIQATDCRPAEGDTGHQRMCSYLSDAEGLMSAIASERPLLGRPLDDVLAWPRQSRSSGCYCDADSRLHKWGLAFEAIHFALARSPELTALAPASS